MSNVVEQRWQEYRKLLWHHIPEDSHQAMTLKANWYSAWLDSIMYLTTEAVDMGEDAGAEHIGQVIREAKEWLRAYIAAQSKALAEMPAGSETQQ